MEKIEPVSVAKSIEDGDDHGSTRKDPETQMWTPGYGKQFPTLGFASLAIFLLCTAGSAAVLVSSNHKSSAVWIQSLAPNICIQAINAFSGIMLAAAITQGVAIAWWRKASRGATVAQLHHSWESSTGMSKILTNILTTDSVALAALAGYFAIIHGVLFQRATGTYTGQDQPRAISAITAAATEFPMTGFVVSNDTYGAQAQCGCFMIGDAYTSVVNTWQTSNGFFEGYNDWFRTTNQYSWLHKMDDKLNNIINNDHCSGTCYTDMEAIGFEIDCTENEANENIAAAPIAAYQAAGNGTTGDSAAWTGIPIFNSSFVVVYPEDPSDTAYIQFNLHYFQSQDPYDADPSSCPGRVVDTSCKLRPALVTYPVKITNYTNQHIINGVALGTQAQLDSASAGQVSNSAQYNFNTSLPVADTMPYSASLKQAEGFTVNQVLNVSDSHTIGGLTGLGGIANALHLSLTSSATISYSPSADDSGAAWALNQNGMFAQTMMYGPPNMGSCDCSFRNESLDVVVQSINQLMFLTAIGMVDHDSFANRTVTAGEAVTILAVGQNSTTTFRSVENTMQIRDVVFYRTNFLFMGLAIGFSVLCVLLVVPSFWRYGELGRKVTLGPIEVAHAFHAPLLTEGQHDTLEQGGDIQALLHAVGHHPVQYGFTEATVPTDGDPGSPASYKRTTRLEIAAPEKVRPVSAFFSSAPNSPRFFGSAPNSPRPENEQKGFPSPVQSKQYAKLS